MAGLLIQATQDVIAAVGLRPLALLPLGLAVVSATTCACLTARLLRSLGQLFAVRLGLRGEQAIGEKLIEVAYCGLRTFHDVPGDGAWNIDHVVVGTQGVFVIETKTRRKPRAGKSDQARWKVLFDGAALQFPHGKDLKAVVQAQANARWLSNYLAKKTGDAVWVEPLVAIPGWWVETTVKDPAVLAVNAKQLASYLRSLPTARVPASQVNRIIGALEEKCRTLEF